MALAESDTASGVDAREAFGGGGGGKMGDGLAFGDTISVDDKSPLQRPATRVANNGQAQNKLPSVLAP